MKNNKGITLIALVITIIVLLILAGISIAMLTGENGILTKATSAGSQSESSQAAEMINLKLNEILASILAGDTTITGGAVKDGTKTYATITVDGDSTTGWTVEVKAGANKPEKVNVTGAGIKKGESGKYEVTPATWSK